MRQNSETLFKKLCFSLLFLKNFYSFFATKSKLELFKKRIDQSTTRHDKDFACGGGGGGLIRPIPRDGAADQLRGVPVIGRFPTDGTRGPEVIGYGRIWPDADVPVQGNLARDVKGPVIQNHSCCMKESQLDQPCGDKS